MQCFVLQNTKGTLHLLEKLLLCQQKVSQCFLRQIKLNLMLALKNRQANSKPLTFHNLSIAGLSFPGSSQPDVINGSTWTIRIEFECYLLVLLLGLTGLLRKRWIVVVLFAIDLALQASPDHPWVSEHPDWFTTRADGSIAYAENPPKKYQDIYPLNFDNDPEGIYAEVLRIVRQWMDHGVRIFRVDNPHTKPLRFWERLLGEIRGTDPDVLFLAEAFTRPAMMHTLAKIGFHQSYTYFTWRNGAQELEEYMLELSGDAAAYMRPNFFTNTPDILNEYLQHGGVPAFKIRAVLAAMLSPAWGIYSGYELCENVPIRPGSEEYMDSEKYQYRPRDWEAAARDGIGIADYITELNRIRRAHPALHRLRNLRFHAADQPGLMCFSKRVAGARTGLRDDTVLVVANLDPYQTREATVWLDLPALGVDREFIVTDELTGESYRWGHANYVRLNPATRPAHVFSVTPPQLSRTIQ